ncbi:hypothetical protein DIPPA_06611 [Diplonema papillatum]|nr:hypothetical protein DIPPA_06611 [Diplonema papillatum]
MDQGPLRTVHVGNVPIDATDRELYLLFSTSPGFEKSLLVRKSTRPYGFVLYETTGHADAAIRFYNGYLWDAEDTQGIVVTMSSRNMDVAAATALEAREREKRRRDEDEGGYDAAALPNFLAGYSPLPGAAGFNPAKRSRPDTGYDPWDASAPKTKTVYVTGFPPNLSHELFDAFVVANFGQELVGASFDAARGGTNCKVPSGFLGFHRHEDAESAMLRINDFEWKVGSDVYLLKSRIARKEFVLPKTTIAR